MSTFLNLNLNTPIERKFLFKHLLYCFLWVLGIWLIIFRGDYFLIDYLPENYQWILQAIPFIFIIIVLFVIVKSKWYYSLSLIFYPILLITWFIPKTILDKGKIYLLSSYVSFIFNRFKRFKSSIIHTILIVSVFLLLFITDSNVVRIFSMIYLSFFYFKIISKYVRQSLQPVELFGANVEKYFDDIIKEPEKSDSLIQSIENYKKTSDEYDEETFQMKKVERLIIANSLIEYFGSNLSSFKGKRAFVISWIYQLIGFTVITLSYFSFMNFELWIVNPESYSVVGEPNLFDFFYYTLKTFIFSNIEAITPISIIARIIEISSFLTIGVFVLIIVTSVIFSLRQDRLNENIKKATEVCVTQTQYIAKYIENQYKTDIQTVLKEATSIKKSIENIKESIEKIL